EGVGPGRCPESNGPCARGRRRTSWPRSRRSSARSNRGPRRARPKDLPSILSCLCPPLSSSVRECLCSGVETGHSAGVHEDHRVIGAELTLPDEIDQPGGGLAGVDGVEENSPGAEEEPRGLDHPFRRQSIAGPEVVAQSPWMITCDRWEFEGRRVSIVEADDLGLLIGARLADIDAEDRNVAAGRVQSDDQTRLHTRRPAGGDERYDVEAGILDLAEQLVAAVDVSERADGIRPAHGNDIGSLPFSTQLGGTRLGLAEQVTAVAGHGDRIGAEEVEEQEVARVLGRVRPGRAEPDPLRAEVLFDDEVALESL